MPPAVSSDDQRRAASVDELGNMSYVDKPAEGLGSAKDENSGGFMRKAMKLMVPKASSTSKRLSRIG